MKDIVERLESAIRSGYACYDTITPENRARCAFRDAVAIIKELREDNAALEVRLNQMADERDTYAGLVSS